LKKKDRKLLKKISEILLANAKAQHSQAYSSWELIKKIKKVKK